MEINEKTFIESFVEKKLKDRLLFECASLNKRSKFFSRFAHNSEEVLDSATVILRTDKLSKETLKDLFCKLKIIPPKQGTIFASNQESMELSYDNALTFLDNTYSECIIMFDNGCAIVKEETSIGSPERFVLYNSKR